MNRKGEIWNGLCICSLLLALVSIFIPVYGWISLAALLIAVCGIIQAKRRFEKGKCLAVLSIVVSVITGVCALILYNNYNIKTLFQLMDRLAG